MPAASIPDRHLRLIAEGEMRATQTRHLGPLVLAVDTTLGQASVGGYCFRSLSDPQVGRTKVHGSNTMARRSYWHVVRDRFPKMTTWGLHWL